MNFYDLKSIRKERPLIAAHRGTMGANVPCNTLESFDIAIRQGADIVELDVTKSLDGELFVFHPYMDFAHLGKLIPMQFKLSKFIKEFRYRNIDFTKTECRVSTLDEVLDYLKGRCIINIDKFWKHPRAIFEKMKSHDMCDQIIVKSYLNEDMINFLSSCDVKLPYMLMVKEQILGIEKEIKSKGINIVAEELVFDNMLSPLVTEENFDRLNKLDIYSWVNTIVYDFKAIIAGGLTDDRAVLGEQDEVWGFLKKVGVDIIQTDWVRELSLFLLRNNQVE